MFKACQSNTVHTFIWVHSHLALQVACGFVVTYADRVGLVEL